MGYAFGLGPGRAGYLVGRGGSFAPRSRMYQAMNWRTSKERSASFSVATSPKCFHRSRGMRMVWRSVPLPGMFPPFGVMTPGEHIAHRGVMTVLAHETVAGVMTPCYLKCHDTP